MSLEFPGASVSCFSQKLSEVVFSREGKLGHSCSRVTQKRRAGVCSGPRVLAAHGGRI